jgi:hypothetical protein
MNFSHLHKHKNTNILRKHPVNAFNRVPGRIFLHLGFDHLREIQASKNPFLYMPIFMPFSL